MELLLRVLHAIEELIMSLELYSYVAVPVRATVNMLQIAQSYYLLSRIHPNTYHAYIHSASYASTVESSSV